MVDLFGKVKERLPLTIGDTLAIADNLGVDVVDVILMEEKIKTGKGDEEILQEGLKEFQHNLNAIDIGLTYGKSLLFGTIGSELNKIKGPKIVEDQFIDKALVYTLAAQVGNHEIGLRPCAGTGDSCPYAGLLKALMENDKDDQTAEVACLILKIGSMFRVGKTTTGCNMEGFGAGAAATAAAITYINGGTPKEMEKAMVLAISPTIANPCTPRVMVPGLCATHIGGAILIGNLAAKLALNTNIEVNVPIDVMVAMAAEVHPISAKHVVPTVIKYMEPFFKTKEAVEKLVDQKIKDREAQRIEETKKEAEAVAKRLAKGAKPITETLGEVVVGGSSQAVGSPTNAARIAHYLAKGRIKKVTIELYPELFARRGINVPGILMGAIFGASTADFKMYKEVMEMAEKMDIAVEIKEINQHQVQRITIEAEEENAMVDTYNRGGGRLVLRDASPSLEEAVKIANRLGIVLAE